MQVQNVETRQAKLVRQSKDFEEAGVDGSVIVPLPFATNFDKFLNVEALAEIGVNALGLARQMDQVLKENLGNAWAAQVRKSLTKTKSVPPVEKFADLVSAYDFSGIRTASEDALSEEEKFERTEIRKALRDLLRAGSLHPEGMVILVQTKPEADKGELAANKIDIDTYEALVDAASEFGVAEIEWENCADPENNTTWKVSFEGEPEFNTDGEALNLAAVVVAAKQLAAEKLATRAKRAGTVKPALTRA
jgi:hypothetical protein